MNAKSNKVIVYLAEDEKKKIEAAARDSGLKVSTYMRLAALKEAN